MVARQRMPLAAISNDDRHGDDEPRSAFTVPFRVFIAPNQEAKTGHLSQPNGDSKIAWSIFRHPS